MQKRIEEVKGTYSIQSELQKGTTITILLTQNQQA
jgi:signal transduction histidine kinase